MGTRNIEETTKKNMENFSESVFVLNLVSKAFCNDVFCYLIPQMNSKTFQ